MKGQISPVLDSLNVRKRLGIAVVLCGLLSFAPYLAVTQGQTQIGPQPAAQSSSLIGVTDSTQNPLQIAILHWYKANLTTTFKVGTFPSGAVFDGANIWVAASA
jgi:hypothetical protein